MIAGHASGSDVDGLADQQLRTGILAVRIAWIPRVEMAAAVRAEAVDRIEIQRRRTEILDGFRIRFFLADGGQIQCDVVVDELTEIGEARGNFDIVPGGAARIGVGHRRRKLLQRPVADRERIEVGKHSAEHSGIVVPRVERLARRMAARGAVARSNVQCLYECLLHGR